MVWDWQKLSRLYKKSEMKLANLLKVSNYAILMDVPKDEVYIEITDKQRYLL
ncbi:hypothetical protein YA163_04870 [Tetragenococcus halophilus]|nr:hypothetical protein YA163_04870 [Tetragenococcus halophilus]GMA44635.1 hypothetical protein GCM10025853_20920 [Tetragenococcus halophilus subsp. halophilus DSM 20339]